jgi:hypothetical protein
MKPTTVAVLAALTGGLALVPLAGDLALWASLEQSDKARAPGPDGQYWVLQVDPRYLPLGGMAGAPSFGRGQFGVGLGDDQTPDGWWAEADPFEGPLKAQLAGFDDEITPPAADPAPGPLVLTVSR